MDWLNNAEANTSNLETITICLLNKNDSSVIERWTLTNAWPTKFLSSDLPSVEDKLVIQELKITFEDISKE